VTGDGTWTAPGQAFWQKARRDTDWQSWAAPPRPGRGWRIFWRVVAVVVAVGLVAIFVASRWVVPYYAITPGTPLNVSQLISVPAGEAHAHRGGVILTDVTYERLTALGYLTYHFDADAQIVSAAEFTGGASSVAYEEEGVIDMWTAREAAVLVALRELGSTRLTRGRPATRCSRSVTSSRRSARPARRYSAHLSPPSQAPRREVRSASPTTSSGRRGHS
jgi:hypothetical protein